MMPRISFVPLVAMVVLPLFVSGCTPHMKSEMTGYTNPEEDAKLQAESQTGSHVTDLSSLSTRSSVPDSNSVATQTAQAVINQPPQSEQEAFLDSPGAVRHVGSASEPTEERLLNVKAAQFADISSFMLNHLYEAVHQQQKTNEDINRLRLPTEMKSTIITATLDKTGNLRGLVIEQHSGKAAVDRMFVDACKQALWISNPRPEALTPDGVYKVRIDARMENELTMDGTHWTFATYLGLAML